MFTHVLNGKIKYSSISYGCRRCDQRCDYMLWHCEKGLSSLQMMAHFFDSELAWIYECENWAELGKSSSLH